MGIPATSRNGGRACLAVVAAVGATWLAPAAAHAAPACGSSITTDTVLTQDLSCPQQGLFVTAGVTLDLGGHTITGAGPATQSAPPYGVTAGVRVEANGATVRNGTIRGFNVGVTTLSSAGGANITGLTLTGNRNAVLLQFNPDTGVSSNGNVIQGNSLVQSTSTGANILGSWNVVMNNTIQGNGQGGVFLNGDGNILSGNTISGNVGNGLQVGSSTASSRTARGNVVDSNTFSGNGSPANTFPTLVDFGSGTAITNNHVTGIARAAGIHVGSLSSGASVSNNTVDQNTDGIFVNSAATSTRISGNLATQNTDDGIDVRSVSTSVASNTATFNGNFGIRAVTGVTDGGGNQAFGNAVGQCTPNIACT